MTEQLKKNVWNLKWDTATCAGDIRRMTGGLEDFVEIHSIEGRRRSESKITGYDLIVQMDSYRLFNILQSS